jgi:N-(2-amino-2-carboxyethyl)-L-glutamate synthase
MVEPNGNESVDLLRLRIERAKSLEDGIPNSFWCNQYANPDNWRSHHQTMKEIVDSLGDPPDYLFCCVSSCGTIRGCVDYIRRQKLSTKVVAVDSVGSVIFGGAKGVRLIPGMGASRRPENWTPNLADDVVRVSDLDCVEGCQRLVQREGILAGGSSGGALIGFERYLASIRSNARCAVILPDRGDRYLDTIYCDEWVRRRLHGGNMTGGVRVD